MLFFYGMQSCDTFAIKRAADRERVLARESLG